MRSGNPILTLGTVGCIGFIVFLCDYICQSGMRLSNTLDDPKMRVAKRYEPKD